MTPREHRTRLAIAGEGQVHHRRLKERLAGSHEWEASQVHGEKGLRRVPGR